MKEVKRSGIARLSANHFFCAYNIINLLMLCLFHLPATDDHRPQLQTSLPRQNFSVFRFPLSFCFPFTLAGLNCTFPFNLSPETAYRAGPTTRGQGESSRKMPINH